MRRRLVAITASTLALAGLTAVGAGTVRADDPPAGSTTTIASSPIASTPIAPTAAVAPAAVASTTTTLPLFGVPLTVDVSTDAGGALTTVAVNPADAYTAVALRPNKVVFVADDGQSKVVVSTRHGVQAITARVSELADILGPGGWSGDVFGTGAPTTVGYEIVAAADGSPDIANVTSSDATAVIGTVEHGTPEGDDGEGDRQYAHATVRFTSGQRTRTLHIVVGVGTHDGERHAVLSIALSREHAVEVPVADGIGSHTWTGPLCDGTTATISFDVAEDGTVSNIVATPTPQEIRDAEGHRSEVVFSPLERVVIGVKLGDGTMKVIMAPRIRCNGGAPDVNTATSIPTSAPGDDHHDGEGDGDHRGNGDNNGGDNNGNGDDSGDGDGNGQHHGKHGDDPAPNGTEPPAAAPPSTATSEGAGD